MRLLSNNVTQKFAKVALTAKVNSPHAFFIVGVGGVIGATVLACRATLKLDETLDEIKTDLDAVKHLGEVSTENGTDYIHTEHKRDLVYVYTKSSIKLGRLYAPSILVGGTAIACLTGSHVQLTRRNAALSATLSALTTAYDEYRSRIQEEIGASRELEIYRDVKEKLIGEDGRQVFAVGDPNRYSPYARIFDESNPNWAKDAEYNFVFLQAQQNHANYQLKARGYVFLNDVYESLGIERSKAGQVVGWFLDGEGDGFVDFGLFSGRERANAFVNGQERSIVLDFNVDGVIWEKF